MEISIIIYTDNSEKWISKVLKRLNKYRNLETVQFVFTDNLSNDETVPIIISTISYDFINEERYKFFMNTTKKEYKDSIDMALGIKECDKYILIDHNLTQKQIDRMIKEIM